MRCNINTGESNSAVSVTLLSFDLAYFFLDILNCFWELYAKYFHFLLKCKKCAIFWLIVCFLDVKRCEKWPLQDKTVLFLQQRARTRTFKLQIFYCRVIADRKGKSWTKRIQNNIEFSMFTKNTSQILKQNILKQALVKNRIFFIKTL